ncbi:MAG: Ig-like domain-containing protein [Lachnospiraceae bacterium]|nr:Ig-like domain-containing protein [Lachnospiraceae bacterium]
MIRNIGKKVLVFVLTAALLGSSLQLSGNTLQVTAKEINNADSKDMISGNGIVLHEAAEEEQPKEGQTEEEQREKAENEIIDEGSDGASDLSETQETGVVSERMHIGQTENMENLPDLDAPDFDCTYDLPIVLTASGDQIRLFANWGAAVETRKDNGSRVTNWQYSYIGGCGSNGESGALKCPYEGVLTWSILRGRVGTAQGTTNLLNEEDDWTDFETVSSSPLFTMHEDEEKNSAFYKTVTIASKEDAAGETNINWYYDYYIRATFRYVKEQTECTAITTVPVTVQDAAGEEDTSAPGMAENAAAAGTGDSLIDEEEGAASAETDEEVTTTGITEDSPVSMESEEGQPEKEQLEDRQDDVPAQEILNVNEADDFAIEAESVYAEEPNSVITSGEDNAEAESGESGSLTESVIGVSKLSLNRTSAVLNPGDTLKLSAAVVPEGLSLNVVWTSSDETAATVDDKGNITALAEGSAVITAECGGKSVAARIDVAETDAAKNGDQPTDEEGNLIEISDDVWIAGFERESGALIYTGGKITQNLRIYHKGTLLKEKSDYTLTYKNNVNAAAYDAAKAPSVTITMKGQYSGSRTLYFTIAPRDIDEEHLQGYEQVLQYAKTLKISTPTLYYGSKKLVANKDFVCDYSTLPANYTKGDSYEDGQIYEYTVNGKGNFTGSFTMTLAVIRDKTLNLGSAAVTVDKKQYEFHGEALSVSDVGIVSVKFGKTVLDPVFYEYEVYAEGVGTGYVEVYPSDAGRNAGYRGMKKVNIKVVGDRSIKNAGLGDEWQASIVFSREKINSDGGIVQEKTGVLVYGEGEDRESLTEGVDYTVKYSNHKKVGTATVTFTGKGRYTGSVKKTYKITANTDLAVQWYDTNDEGMPFAVYRKGGAAPRFDLTEVSENGYTNVLTVKTDYTVTFKNNKNLGTMTCEITGKGNYKGYKSSTQVTVIAADISQCTISIPDKQYSTKKNAWKSSVTIKDVNGKKLAAGTDYDKNLIYRYTGMEEGGLPQPGTIVYVTASGINNYAGSSVTGSYRIYSTSIGKLTVVIDSQEYTGREIELSADDIHVYANKTDAKKGIEIAEPCYEIMGYSNNIKAGTAKVTLRGTGDYGGTRTCSFKITKKTYVNVRVTKVMLDETSVSIGAGNSRQLTATVVPENAYNKTVLWSTSNSKVVTVSKDGVITAVKSGKATITAASQDTGKKATCKVTVSVIPVTSFSLNTTEINQEEGTSYQLEATEIQPEGATYSTIRWESSNPEIVSVDANGLVSLNKAGMAVITAYADGRKFSDKCLVIVNGEDDGTAPDGDYVTPQEYRRADDEDDTAAFNRAIRTFDGNYEILYVPAGTYYINAETGIQLVSKMKLIMSPDAVIKAVGNSSEFYDVILVKEVSQVTIFGGQIKGERYEHTGKAGEWGHGIGVYDSSVITITDVDISECWGDGIYLGTNRTDADTNKEAGCGVIAIQNCRLFDNRRNNMSIVCGDYVTVDQCSFNNAGGTAPEYGIDIETNYTNNPCEHITISDSTFDGNGQGSLAIITAANDVRIEGCTLNGAFINYAGTNVVISDSVINGEADARIGILLENGSRINDGTDAEDVLIASFHAADLDAAEGQYTLGEYGVNTSNLMSWSVIDDSGSSSGKALRLERQSEGTQEAGYYLNLNELTGGELSALKYGATYRFEYVVKGSGQWGIKTDQTGWYPCVPMSDKFSTGIVTYKASAGTNCRLMLYAVDVTEGMWLEVEGVRIYEVR